MDEELKKLIEEYIKNREKWSDQQIADERKSLGKPSWQEEQVLKLGKTDPNDYSDYSVNKIYTPEQQEILDRLQLERAQKQVAAGKALEARGYDMYRKKGHKGSFSTDAFGFKNPGTGKVLKALGPIGLGLGVLGGLTGEASADDQFLEREGEKAGQDAYEKSPARLDKLKALLNKK